MSIKNPNKYKRPQFPPDKERVRNVATHVSRFTRLPVSIQFTQANKDFAAIDMRNNSIYVSESLASEGESWIYFTCGHEFGHGVCFPKTARWAETCISQANDLGYQAPQHIANLLADLLDNDWNMTKTPWKKPFIEEAAGFYKPPKDLMHNPNSRWGFMCRMMRKRILDLKYLKFPQHLDREEAMAYHILFYKKKESLFNRYKEALIVLKNKLWEVDQQENDGEGFGAPMGGAEEGQGGEVGPGGDHKGHKTKLPEGHDMDPEEKREWEKAVSGMGAAGQGSLGNGEKCKYDKEGRRLLFDLAELHAFDELIVVEEEGGDGRDGPCGPRLDRTWLMGDKVSELNLATTIRRYGVVIPEVTTIKQIEGPRREHKNAGTGTLYLLIDTSGSMSGTLNRACSIGWAAMVGARKRRDKGALMAFSSQPTFLQGATYDYEAIKKHLENIDTSGGTQLNPALAEIIRMSKDKNNKPTVLVISDMGIADNQEATLDYIREIKRLGGRTLLCSVDAIGRYGDTSWILQAQNEGIAVAFEVKDFADLTKAVKRVL